MSDILAYVLGGIGIISVIVALVSYIKWDWQWIKDRFTLTEEERFKKDWQEIEERVAKEKVNEELLAIAKEGMES